MLTLDQIVQYQIITHCFLVNTQVTQAEIESLALLAIEGKSDLSAYCELCYERGIFKTAQSVRNAMGKLEKRKLILKTGGLKKQISIHPDLKIFAEGGILLQYNFLFSNQPNEKSN